MTTRQWKKNKTIETPPNPERIKYQRLLAPDDNPVEKGMKG